MKALLKRVVPSRVWEAVRLRRFAFLRFMDAARGSFSFSRPVHSLRILRLVCAVRPEYTMVRPPRLRLLYELSQEVARENVPGDLVECGVYHGGTAAMMMAGQAPGYARTLWLFDSFEGLPPPTEKDGAYEREHYYKGWCKGSVTKVEEIFRTLELPLSKVHTVRGWFSDTFPSVASQVPAVALLHIDADWYESVRLCLETFYPKVSSGGYVELDDYGTWEGCRRAVDEYRAANGITAELKTRDGKGYYFRKPFKESV